MTAVEQRFVVSFREADADEPGLVLEDDGTVWLVAPGGARAQLGGTVTEAGYYSGIQVEAGGPGALNWEILDSGDEVLDVTDPLLPKATKDGLYIISADVQVRNGTGISLATLVFDYGNDSAQMEAQDNERMLVSGSYVLAAGEAIRLQVSADPDVTDMTLKNATVARIGPA